jgi:hypothetical protein
MEETAETIKGQIENEKLVISTEIATFDLSIYYISLSERSLNCNTLSHGGHLILSRA